MVLISRKIEPLLLEIVRACGVPVESVGQLEEGVPNGWVPALLDLTENLTIRFPDLEGRELKAIWQALIRTLGNTDPSFYDIVVPGLRDLYAQRASLKSVLAEVEETFVRLAQPRHFDIVAEVAADRANGNYRTETFPWLARSGDPRATQILLAQLDDVDAQVWAFRALLELKPSGLDEEMRPYVDNPKTRPYALQVLYPHQGDPRSEIVAEIAEAGLIVDSVQHLVQSSDPYPEAISVLIEWLTYLEQKIPGPETAYRQSLREDLIRALTVKEARGTDAVHTISAQFDIDPPINESVLWAAGNALHEIADDALFDDMAKIATNPDHGRARKMVVSWLGKSKHPLATTTALSQLDDCVVTGHAIIALGELKPPGIRDRIEPFLGSENKWIQKEARKTLEELPD